MLNSPAGTAIERIIDWKSGLQIIERLRDTGFRRKDMHTDRQKIEKITLDNLTKLQAEITRVIDETIATSKWSRRWEPLIIAASCLAVCSSVWAVLGKLLVQ
jgi:hypothetical protein